MERLDLRKDHYLFITLKTVCDEESEVIRTNRAIEIEMHDDGNKYIHIIACMPYCETEVWYPCYRWHIDKIENAEW